MNAAQKTFALVDCNNFYASCERVFNPLLANKPIVVLSNNDGCIVSRSGEAKSLGIGMGAPVFECEDLIKKHDIQVFSSNYTLYGDMSARVMTALEHFCPNVEVYSIDEAFLCFTGFWQDLHEYGVKIRKSVKQWTGIPVSIGIGPTKTLAKIANKLAKKLRCGVFNLSERSPSQIDHILSRIPVSDIWGIGGSYTRKLQKIGIYTALDFKHAPDRWVQKHMTIVGLRTVYELRGISCLRLEEKTDPKKNICSSRTFGKPVESAVDMHEAVASYAATAGAKLRSQRSAAKSMVVFISTNRHRENEPQYRNAAVYNFAVPTSSTPELVTGARIALRSILRSGYRYRKAGVLLMGLLPEHHVQFNLFTPPRSIQSHQLMRTFDRLNHKYGRRTLFVAATGMEQSWQTKVQFKSPAFTTNWGELLEVKC